MHLGKGYRILAEQCSQKAVLEWSTWHALCAPGGASPRVTRAVCQGSAVQACWLRPAHRDIHRLHAGSYIRGSVDLKACGAAATVVSSAQCARGSCICCCSALRRRGIGRQATRRARHWSGLVCLDSTSYSGRWLLCSPRLFISLSRLRLASKGQSALSGEEGDVHLGPATGNCCQYLWLGAWGVVCERRPDLNVACAYQTAEEARPGGHDGVEEGPEEG